MLSFTKLAVSNSSKRSMLNTKLKAKSRTKIIWTYVLLFVNLVGAYLGIFHSHRHYSFDLPFWLWMIWVLSLYALDEIWFEHPKWQKLMSVAMMLFVGLPIAWVVVFFHSAFIESQLKGHEVHVNAIVKELYVRKSRRSVTPYAIFSYQANGRTWIQDMVNSDDPVAQGDTIKLICSKLDPEIFIRVNKCVVR